MSVRKKWKKWKNGKEKTHALGSVAGEEGALLVRLASGLEVALCHGVAGAVEDKGDLVALGCRDGLRAEAEAIASDGDGVDAAYET